jgi:hypothetical protein
MLAGIAVMGVIAYQRDLTAKPVRVLSTEGGMQKVSFDPRERPVTSAPPPLWKPEPSLIASKANQLALSQEQLQRLSQLQQDWSASKHQVLKAMSRYTDAAPKGTLPKISADIQGYSELSRQFDADREKFWARSLDLLNSNQRQLVVDLKERTR